MGSAAELSDEDLMSRIRSGNHQAFATLVRRHTQRFYAAAYRIAGKADAAEDIVQEAFLKLWEKPESWDAGRGVKFTTWFYRVVMNLAIDMQRKHKYMADPKVLDFMPDQGPGQDDILSAREEQVLLEAAIANLPERQRTALNLCVYEQLSNKDAAQVMGVKVKALESLLMRAKENLKQQLNIKDFTRKEERSYAGRSR